MATVWLQKISNGLIVVRDSESANKVNTLFQYLKVCARRPSVPLIIRRTSQELIDALTNRWDAIGPSLW
jgi:hypothetical protein